MKRNKIKPKYLKEILTNIEESNQKIDTNINLTKEKINIFDKIERSILNILISFGLIILFLIWSFIPILILEILGIDYNNFNQLGKYIFTLISDILFLILLFIVYKKDIIRDFKNYFNSNIKSNIKTSFLYWGIGFGIMLVSNAIIAIITNGKLATNEEAVRELIQVVPWYMAFSLMIHAPISEELVFRKSLRNITKNPYIYSIISAFIFGGLHVISSLQSPIDLLYLIPYCSLGFMFALLYSKTNNIFSTITIHSFHNTLALIIYLTSI